jgi:hypothetical protein
MELIPICEATLFLGMSQRQALLPSALPRAGVLADSLQDFAQFESVGVLNDITQYLEHN